MGCRWCGYTGWMRQHEEESGWVDIRCPYCVGIDGEEPDLVTEGHDAAMQAEIDAAWREHEEEVNDG